MQGRFPKFLKIVVLNPHPPSYLSWIAFEHRAPAFVVYLVFQLNAFQNQLTPNFRELWRLHAITGVDELPRETCVLDHCTDAIHAPTLDFRKIAVPKRIGLDALVDALGRVVRGTVFEYACDADAREFVRYPHARDTINVYGLKEEMGDLLIRSYSRERYRLDGRTLLSELFVWNPKEGDDYYVYLCVSHAIWDGMSSGAFVTNLSMALSGEQTPVAPATSDAVVRADAQAISGEEFMAAVDAFDDLLCVTRQSYSIEERPMDYAQYLSPIETVMETYVSANPLLKRLREVPLVVLDSGRDATNGRLLGNFLVPRLACYNVESGSVRYVLPTDLPDVGSVLRSKLLRVPLVNYLGVVDTTKATDDYLTLRRQGVLEHAGAGTSITANVEDGTLVVEYPVYAEEV